MKHEPLIHSHITDMLDDVHPLAHQNVYCKTCDVMLHAFNNECMQTWIESGKGTFCIMCFTKEPDIFALDDDYGI